MAWQLIYTSAPRLLEAGRTGFGTVARHREVSGLLATTIERFSQFARLPGHDPKRIIYCHRILSLGTGTFHVLSCLRDAGSDYTGRTNHIAHHVIAQEREIRPLIAAGITPADVLLAMNWRSSWTEWPRFLSASEEIDLASKPTQPAHLWEHFTGIAHACRLPWSSSAQRGCYLIVPHAVNALVLFGESLHAQPNKAWQTTFTTNLEPNDAVADFRWIGMSPESPLRPLMETSARPVFDLQHPSSLPPPPHPESNNAACDCAPVSSENIPTPSAQTESSGESIDETACDSSNRKSDTAAVSHREKKRRSSIRLLIAWVSVLAVIAAVSLPWIARHRKDEEIARLEKTVDDAWNKHHLKLADTKRWLKQQARENAHPDIAARLIASHIECLQQIHDSLENAPASQGVIIPDRTQDDFSEMLTAHDEWLKKRTAVVLPSDWRPERLAEVNAIIERWKEEQRAWKHLAGFFTREPLVDESDRDELIRRVREMLQADSRSASASEGWIEALKELGATTAKAIGSIHITTSLSSQTCNPSPP